MVIERKPSLKLIGLFVVGSILVLVGLGSLSFSYFDRRRDYIKGKGIVDWIEPCFNHLSEEGTIAHIDISSDYFHGCAIYFNECCVSTNPYVNDCLQVKDEIDVWYIQNSCHYSFNGHLFYSVGSNSKIDTYTLFEKLWLPPIIELVVGVIIILFTYAIWKQWTVRLEANKSTSVEAIELKLNAFSINEKISEDAEDDLEGVLT
jgi:hypothetical protein